MMTSGHHLVRHLNWPLVSTVILLCAIGILNLYSAGLSYDVTGITPFYLKQIQWVIIGFVLMVITIVVDYRIIIRYAYVLHALAIGLLVVVCLCGYATRGSQRWITLAGFTFQPSELVKLTLILALARYFGDHYVDGGYRARELIVPFVFVLIPFLLILHQPDLGTALILMLIFVSVVFFVRMRRKDFLIIAIVAITLLPLGWHVLKDYQKERILTFISPERDSLGAGYHIIQSIIAVGSGGVTGKGYLKGTQTQLKFLPEQQTDFVFSVLAEEWGLLGEFFVICIFIMLLRYGFKAAMNARDYFGTLIAFGITMLLFWCTFINISMVLGLLPVVGVPLPFLSYGGSAIASLLVAMGLILNIDLRRFTFHE